MKGYVHAIQLVMVEAVLLLAQPVQPGGASVSDSEHDSNKDGDNDLENEWGNESGLAKLRVTPFHARNMYESDNVCPLLTFKS